MMLDIEEVRILVGDMIEIAPERIDISDDRDDVPGWDSLAHLRVVTALEKRFNIRLTMDQIVRTRTVEQLSRIVDGM